MINDKLNDILDVVLKKFGDAKEQTLIIIDTVAELDEMTIDDLEAFYKIYELNYSEKVSSSLNNAISDLYSYAVNKIVSIGNVEKLEKLCTNHSF